MIDQYRHIAAAAAWLADRLPYPVMESIAGAVLTYGGVGHKGGYDAILRSVPMPDFRDATSDFLDNWYIYAAGVGVDAVAMALLSAATSEREHQREQIVEVVWTGPEPAATRFRQTEQAILEVVNSATKRLTVVSYAVYRIPRIREALMAAAGRRVRITLIVETPNRIEGQGEYDCLRALGGDVEEVSAVYYWPQDQRARDDNGKIGILHVKCAVADGHQMFLSSANLTEYAFSINMELGLLVTGGRLPGEVQRHFERLVDQGVLERV